MDITTIETEAEKAVDAFLAVAGPLETMLPMLEVFLPEAEKKAVNVTLAIIRELEKDAPLLKSAVHNFAQMERSIVDAVNKATA